MAPAIYIHETITITVKERQDYLDLFCTWGPITSRLYGMECFGVWATVGSTGPWPEAICMWELADVDALAAMLSGEFQYLVDDDSEVGGHYETFWGTHPHLQPTDGVDRLLVPTASSPRIADALAQGIRGQGYYHEIVTTSPGRIEEYLERHERVFRPLAEANGLVFLGAYRTLLRNDTEAVVIWGLPTWAALRALDGELRTGAAAQEWRAWTLQVGATWEGKLLTPAARSPLSTGELLV